MLGGLALNLGLLHQFLSPGWGVSILSRPTVASGVGAGGFYLRNLDMGQVRVGLGTRVRATCHGRSLRCPVLGR